MKFVILLGLSLCFVLGVNAQGINSEKSLVNFTIDGMFGVEVAGTFIGMKGVVEFDPSAIENANFDVSINAASVFTDNKKRDEHLKNEDFFEIETYSTISFKSTAVSKNEVGFQTKGELTMHGVSQPVTIDFTYEDNRLVGQLSIKRLDYKLGETTKTNKVADSAQIEIICVLN